MAAGLSSNCLNMTTLRAADHFPEKHQSLSVARGTPYFVWSCGSVASPFTNSARHLNRSAGGWCLAPVWVASSDMLQSGTRPGAAQGLVFSAVQNATDSPSSSNRALHRERLQNARMRWPRSFWLSPGCCSHSSILASCCRKQRNCSDKYSKSEFRVMAASMTVVFMWQNRTMFCAGQGLIGRGCRRCRQAVIAAK